MSQARSQVQVTITGNLDKGFDKAFQAADDRMEALGRASSDLNRKMADIGAYRRQQNALKDAASEYTKAKAKVAELQAALVGVEKPTRKQASQLAAAERAASRAGAAYGEARTKLADMGRELQRGGVNVSKLSSEYQRLKAQLAAMGTESQRVAKLQSQADKESIQRQHRLEDVLRRRRIEQEKEAAILAKQQARIESIAKAWNGVQAVAVGTMAAGAVLAQPTKKALTYEEQLAYMADTAAAGQSPEQKAATQKQLSDSVEAARQYSKGATREDVATALQSLIASGQFEGDAAAKALPVIARTGFAGGASPLDISNIAISAKAFGVSDLEMAFDKALRAGQLGRNELKNMAPALPSQMALARAVGMTGDKGFTDLLALNQVAMSTAGNAEEANNNVINMLQKLSSREFSDSVAKNVSVQRGDPYIAGKKGAKEFDFATYLTREREKGVNAVDAFNKLMDRELAGDKKYKAAMAKLDAAKGEDRKQAAKDVVSIVEGSAFGQLVADRQALMGFIAARNGQQKMGELRTGIDAAKGFVNQSAEFLGGQNFAGAKMLAGNVDRANEQAYSQLEGPLKSVIDTLNQATQEFPKLTTAAYGAATALGALAAAGVGVGAYNLLKGGAAGAAAGAAGAATAGAAGAAGTAAAGGVAAGLAARAAPVLKGAAIAAAGGYAADAAAGVLGAGGQKIDEKQDAANWSKMSLWQKAESGAARSIESIGGLLFMDNMVNSARAARIRDETAYLNPAKPAVATPRPVQAPGAKPVAAAPAAPAAAQPPQQAQQVTAAITSMNGVATTTAAAAQQAAAAAQETAKAATTAAGRPNITNTYTVTVTAPQGADPAQMRAAVTQALQEAERRNKAEQRSSLADKLGY